MSAFTAAAHAVPPSPVMAGRGVVIAAGGAYLPGAYVVVRLLRHWRCKLPIEIWHAGEEELTPWARDVFAQYGAALRDAIRACPDRPPSQLRGWPIKPAAILSTTFREVLFLDADCFPGRDPAFLFSTPEYTADRAVFWPDTQSLKLGPSGSIWAACGMSYRGDAEFESGIMLIDREACWRQLWLADWMNRHSEFWYKHVHGDKDTFYLAWRKMGCTYSLAPSAKRYKAVLTRHFWHDGKPLADHKTGTGKYVVPERVLCCNRYAASYPHRPKWKNVYDEIVQRLIVANFALHARFLRELRAIAHTTE